MFHLIRLTSHLVLSYLIHIYIYIIICAHDTMIQKDLGARMDSLKQCLHNAAKARNVAIGTDYADRPSMLQNCCCHAVVNVEGSSEGIARLRSNHFTRTLADYPAPRTFQHHNLYDACVVLPLAH